MTTSSPSAYESTFAGMNITRLEALAGQTPFYAYDRKAINNRVAALREALPESIRIHFAIKANPMPALVAHMAQRLDGLDVASAGELRVALASGMSAQNISFAGPGKSDADLRAALGANVLLNVESMGELKRIRHLRDDTGWQPRIALRINPDFELKASGMRMGGGAKPFGIDAEAVPAALEFLTRHKLPFEGFHLFAGSQNLRSESIVEAQSKSWELIQRLSEHAPTAPTSINLGGGFGIPYFPRETPLQLDAISDNLARIASECATHIPGAHIKLELGRYLVGEAGLYVFKVVDRKLSRGEVFLVTNGGLHHHLAASGNFGQVLRKNYPLKVMRGQQIMKTEESVSVVGPLCTPLDLLGDKVLLSAGLQPGDLLAIEQSGAYGPSASPSSFLGHPPAVEILI